jgi:hypothetical protein
VKFKADKVAVALWQFSSGYFGFTYQLSFQQILSSVIQDWQNVSNKA